MTGHGCPVDDGRIRSVGPLVAAVLLLSLLNFCFAPAQAQILAGNVGQTDAAASYAFGTLDIAQAFTTGDATSGYRLTTVEVRLADTAPTTASTPPTIKIFSGSATDTEVASLSAPSTLGAGPENVIYAAPLSVTLAANTQYWLVAEGGSTDVRWVATASTAQDQTSNWTIATRGETRAHDSTGPFTRLTDQATFQFRVSGSPVDSASPGDVVLSFGAGTPASGIDVYGNPFDVYVETDADLAGSVMEGLFRGVPGTPRYEIQGGRHGGFTAINNRRFKYQVTPDNDTELVTLEIDVRALCAPPECSRNYRVANTLNRTFGLERMDRPVSIAPPGSVDEGSAAVFTISRDWSDRPAEIPVTITELEGNDVIATDTRTVSLAVGATSADLSYVPEVMLQVQPHRSIRARFDDGRYYVLPAISEFTVPVGNVETAPGSVVSLFSSGSGRSVYLSWTHPTNIGGAAIGSYEVRWKEGDGAFNSWRLFKIADPGTGEYLTGLENSTTYTIQVRARNAVGPGPAAETTATTTGRPAPPSGFGATAGNKQATLAWQPPSGDAVDRYEVRWRADGERYSAWTDVGNVVSYAATGLRNETVYTFQVRTVNAAGASRSVSTDAVPMPGAPLPVITIVGPGSVAEGGDAVFTLTREGGATVTLDVAVAVAETGDMVAGTAEGSRSVTFAAGAGSATVTVASQDDTLGEDDSELTVTIVREPDSYRTGGAASATVLLVDDDPPSAEVVIEVDPPAYVEGLVDGFGLSRLVSWDFVLEGPPLATELTINWRLGPGTATAITDYVDTRSQTGVINGRSTLSAGNRVVTFQSCCLRIIDDMVMESNETIVISGTTSVSGITVRTAELIILDNDTPAESVDGTPPVLRAASVNGAALTLTFSETLGAAASLAKEAFTVAATPAGEMEETVSLTGSPSVSGTTVTLTLANAALFTDTGFYVSYAAPTEGSNNAIVDEAGNKAADFSRTRAVNLTRASDLPIVTVTVPSASRTVSEGQPASFEFSRTTSSAALTVKVDVAESGRMLSGTTPGEVQFGAGSATATLSVSTADDAVHEPGSVITARILDDPGSYVVGTASSARATVEDNDARPTRIVASVDPAVVSEGSYRVINVRFSFDGAALDRDTTVTWRVGPGTASRDEFGGTRVFLSQQSTIAAGSRESNLATMGVVVFEDDFVEGTETMLVTGTSDVPGLPMIREEVSIADNDNSAPAFTEVRETRTLSETLGSANETAARNVGAPVSAADADEDTLRYQLEGPEAGAFDIDHATGQIATRTDRYYSFESATSYALTVKVGDGRGGADTVPVTVTIVDQDEPPPVMEAPTVTSTEGSNTSLDVAWVVPGGTAGRPPITGYDLQYRETGKTVWTAGPRGVAGTSTSIPGLKPMTEFQVQVRAVNDEGEGGWSGHGSARTGIATEPGAPANLVGVGGVGRVLLSWTAPPEDGGAAIESYEYRHRKDTDTDYPASWTAVDDGPDGGTDTGDETSLAVTGLENGTLYRFQLRARNRVGAGAAIETTATPVSSGGCAAPDLSGRRQAWQGVMTVGRAVVPAFKSTPEKQVGWGWDKWAGSLTARGAPIVIGSNRYFIGDLIMLFDYGSNLQGLLAPPSGTLVLNLDKVLTSADEAALRLDVCDTAFAFADATGPKGVAKPGHKTDIDWYWESAGLTWMAGQTRILTLSVAEAEEAAVAAAVAGMPEPTGPGEDGAYARGDRIEARVEFTAPVTVDTAEGSPTLGIALGGMRREAAYESGSGTAALVFALAVAGEDDGAGAATVIANGVRLNGATIRDGEGNDANLSFGQPPGVVALEIAPEPGGDGAWREGDSVTVTLAFAEPVQVATDDGTPSIGLLLPGARVASYTSGSGTDRLTFSYALTAKDGSVSGVLVEADSLALNGGAITSTGGLEAALGHDGAGATAIAPRVTGPSLSVADAEGAEGARLRFTVTLSPPASKTVTVAWATADGTARAGEDYTAASGTLSFKRGETEKTVEVALADDGLGEGEETFTLTLSDAKGAAVTDGEATGTIRPSTGPPPFTAAFHSVPAEHDGQGTITLELRFSEAPAAGLSYLTVQNSLMTVAGGSLTRARRIEPPSNLRFELTLRPAGNGAVSLARAALPACGQSGAVCTSDGRTLTGALSRTVPGPAALSVADAEVEEGADAKLAFAVTLDRARHAPVTVDWATRDGTAVAGEDYTAASGGLTFAAGETEKTVEVAVLPDAHDESAETMTLVLSNPAGARIADGEATGTIRNAGAIPKAWIARFGRTVAEQVLGAVESRMRAARRPGAKVSVAGETIGLGAVFGHETGAGPDAAAKAQQQEARNGRETERFTGRLWGDPDPEDEKRPRTRAVTWQELRRGSSFALTAGAPGKGFVSLWGRAAVSRFNGREDELSLDGEVASGLLGVDRSREDWTAGLILSHSAAEGGYRGDSTGKVEAGLTGLYPWGRVALNDRLEVWGTAGYGWGTLTLTPDKPGGDGAGPALRTGLDLGMAAVGLRGALLRPGAGVGAEADAGAGARNPPADGLTVTAKTDALVVRTVSEAVSGPNGELAAARTTVTRLRFGLEGALPVRLRGEAALTPSAEIGVRHDGGDAETGFGLDLGGGLALADPERGLRGEIRGRGLLSHESAGFRERGFSGAIAWNPTPGERGLNVSLSQTVGRPSSGGADDLLSRTTLEDLVANDDGDDLESRRLELRVGYGFSAFGDRFTSTPETGIGFSDVGRDYSLGWRLVRWSGSGGESGSFELSFEARRRENARDNTRPEHELGLRLTSRW